MRHKIHTDNAPQVIGPYSQSIKAGNIVYLSGQIPLDPKTMMMASDSIEGQVAQVFTNLQEICKEAGGSLDSIVKLTIYLTDLQYFHVVNEIMMGFFKEPYPARTTIQATSLPRIAKIEVDAIMVV